jgi:UDP-glucuronate 4-epimerase
MARILVTGAAGFIGSVVSRRLLGRGDQVVGVDNLSPYYDVTLKADRLTRLSMIDGFKFQRLDLANRDETAALFAMQQPDAIVHLAAQAGVRLSMTSPASYVDANLVGFGNVLEGARKAGVQHLVFASSSSVYGANSRVPFTTHDGVDHPVSFYAATKKANEAMAHAYSHQFGLPVSGLRYFTVYGPWGRPDMAYFRFTKAILEGEPIELYAEGQARRDFTYIDDAAEATVRVLDTIPTPDPAWSPERPDPATSSAPYRIYNVGNHDPVVLTRFVEILEAAIGKPAVKEYKPLPPADVLETYADVSGLEQATGFSPSTPLDEGLARFVSWFREYYGV